MENQMEQRSVKLEIRNTDFENRSIEGYAAVFSEEFVKLRDRWGDTFYEKVTRGAFLKTLASKERDKFMLINHDWNKVVGRTNSNLTLEEDDHGLRFKLEVPNTTDGNDLLENVRLGLIKGCSFGFNIVHSKTNWDDNWTFYREITEVELFEVTATPLPAYADTEIEARSELCIKTLREEAKGQNEPQEPQAEQGANVLERNANILASFFIQNLKEN